MEFEQMGLQNIARVGPDLRDACQLKTIMVVQSHSEIADQQDPLKLPSLMDAEISQYFNYPLVAQFWPA